MLETGVSASSYGGRKVDLSASGSSGGVGYLVDASRFDTDGYRAHSAARREQAFAKFTLNPGAGSKLTLVANSMDQDAQDPLGQTWASYQRDRRGGEPDATDAAGRSIAERYDTRKRIRHQQAGLNFEGDAGGGRLGLSLYGGNRHVTQYQSFNRNFQASSSHSGGVIDFARDFYGANLQWRKVAHIGAGTLTATAGLEYGRSRDDRQGYENFELDQDGAPRYGRRGTLRRDEADTVSTLDPYVQGSWASGRWEASAGLRHSSMRVAVRDRFLANGDDSGSLRYSRSTPTLGLLYKLAPQLNLYASAARGFEAPTLNESFYSSQGGGFNYRLAPATSTHLELGAKAILARRTRAELALFQVRTSDELVVDSSSGGRSSYRNAGATLRQGLELSLDARWEHGLSTRLAATRLRAVYDAPFGAVPAGRHLPGVPESSLYGELAWKNASGSLGAALEGLAAGSAHADDANAQQPAPGYGVLNLRADVQREVGPWKLKLFARLDNLLDRHYVGSLIVGDSNQRYYEAAPGRNWLTGARLQLQW